MKRQTSGLRTLDSDLTENVYPIVDFFKEVFFSLQSSNSYIQFFPASTVKFYSDGHFQSKLLMHKT